MKAHLKKLLLIIPFLSTLLCSAGDNKEDDDNDRHYGIRAGYQSSDLVRDEKESMDTRDGFYFGFVRRINLIPLFKLETGLEYMQAGAILSDTSERRLNYIVVPAQLVFKLGPLLALGGINACFKVDENYIVNDTEQSLSDDQSSSFTDFTVDGGVGFKILMVSVEARHYWGLTDINNGTKNRYWQLGLKINF